MQDANKKYLEKIKKVYSFWGRFPYFYDAQDVVTFLGRAAIIRKKAVENIGLKKGDKVLEMACGSGRNFQYLIEAVGQGGRIIGFDYSQEMLDAAKQLCERNSWNNITLIQGDASQLQIDENNFDGVLSVLGISAIPDWEKALDRCYNVLRHGGRLVVCDARLFTGFLKFFNPLVKLIYSKFAAWDPSKNIPKKIEKIFGNVKMENFNFNTFFIAVAVKMEE